MKIHCNYTELQDPDTLVEHPKNPNKHEDLQIEALAKIIQHQGWRNPIVVSKRSGYVIAGHGRLMASKLMGAESVPVDIQDFEDEASEYAHMIADNKIAEFAEMDDSIIAELLEELPDDFDLDLAGLIDGIDMDSGVEPEEDDFNEDPPENPTTQPGQIFKLGNHRLMCGDSTKNTDVEKLTAGEVLELMITDPPYGVNYDANWRNKRKRADGTPIGAKSIGKVLNDNLSDWSKTYNLFQGKVAYVWHAQLATHVVAENLEGCDFVLRNLIVWAKNNHAISQGHYHHKHEPCWYAVKKGETASWVGDRSQTTLWEIDKPLKNETGHSTQKPVECMLKPMKNHKGNVYDPFLGSGTTLIAAEQLGRTCYGMELDPGYCDVIIKRWEEYTGGKAELIE